MPNFLIEIPHEEEMVACARAIHVLLTTGSHFVSHAEFGCKDGDHRSWMIVEVKDKAEAMQIIPPVYRSLAHVVQLNRFTVEELEELMRQHKG